GVMIAVRDALHYLKGLAAVGGFMEWSAACVNDLIVLRVDANLAVVHRAIIVIAHNAPGLALVVRTPDAAAFGIGGLIGWRLLAPANPAAPAAPAAARLFFTAASAAAGPDLDLRIDDVRIRPRDVEADAAQQTFRQAIAFEFRPGLAGVGCLPDGAAGAA